MSKLYSKVCVGNPVKFHFLCAERRGLVESSPTEWIEFEVCLGKIEKKNREVVLAAYRKNGFA